MTTKTTSKSLFLLQETYMESRSYEMTQLNLEDDENGLDGI